MKHIRSILGTNLMRILPKVTKESGSLLSFGIPGERCVVSRIRNSIFKIKDFTNIALTKNYEKSKKYNME